MFCILRRFGGVDYFLLCESLILVFYCQFKKRIPMFLFPLPLFCYSSEGGKPIFGVRFFR